MMTDNQGAFVEALQKDFKKAEAETLAMEVNGG
jgi:hypothetical protein